MARRALLTAALLRYLIELRPRSWFGRTSRPVTPLRAGVGRRGLAVHHGHQLSGVVTVAVGALRYDVPDDQQACRVAASRHRIQPTRHDMFPSTTSGSLRTDRMSSSVACRRITDC